MTVAAGSVAIVGIINGLGADDTAPNFSYVAFVLRNPIASGESLWIGDSPNGATAGAEGVIQLTFNQTYSAGTVVIVRSDGTIDISDTNGGITAANITGTLIGGGPQLASGDQVYISNSATFTQGAGGSLIAGVDFSGNFLPIMATGGFPLNLDSNDIENSDGMLWTGGDPKTASVTDLTNPANYGFGDANNDDYNVTVTQLASITCFYPGTMIATPEGEKAVETLAIGDLVLTHDGRAEPVRWMGRQTVSLVFADKLRALPIRVKAGALAENVPARDLLVSPAHALYVDGSLVVAGALVNGTSIVRETRVPKTFTYHHVELADHALILAEGAPAETFLDSVEREAFDNWAEHEALYGHLPTPAELPMARVKTQRQLPARLKRQIAERAAALGYTAAAVA